MILDNVVKELVKQFSPYSIFLYGSRAKGDYNKNSDYEIGVIFKDNYFHRSEIAEKIKDKNFSIYPFYLSDIISYDIDVPFVKSIFINSWIEGAAKTIYGEKVIENLSPLNISDVDLLNDMYFNLGLALSAVKVYNTNKSYAKQSFVKACLFGTRDYLYKVKRCLHISYEDIFNTAKKDKILKSYFDLLKTAFKLRANPDFDVHPDILYKNISYLNKCLIPLVANNKINTEE